MPIHLKIDSRGGLPLDSHKIEDERIDERDFPPAFLAA